jgi:hypothetical protein
VVTQVVSGGGRIYVGGGFHYLGRHTGALVGLDAASGQVAAKLPDIEGKVLALAPDGSGGWYVGGSFGSVGGISGSNLARVGVDGSVAAGWPGVNDSVDALAVLGSTLYVGGSFSKVGGVARSHLAAIDAATGAIKDWSPEMDAEGEVRALLAQGSTIYAGGSFSIVGGKARPNVAAVDAVSGAVTAWNPRTSGNGGAVNVLEAYGSAIDIGGAFRAVGGKRRDYLAQVDLRTGAVLPWNPGGPGTVFALAIAEKTLYVAGAGLAAFDASTGAELGWNPVIDSGYFTAITATPDAVYVAGPIVNAGSARESRARLAALDPVSGAALAWNPGANGEPQALAVSGSTVYVGGAFTSAGGFVRTHVAALDAATGSVVAWNPGDRLFPNSYPLNCSCGSAVIALAVSGSTVYVSGADYDHEIASKAFVAAVPARDADADPIWQLRVHSNEDIGALAVSGSTLYLGGSFTRIGGRQRRHLAAVRVGDGSLTEWSVPVAAPVGYLAVFGSRVYAVSADSIVAASSQLAAHRLWTVALELSKRGPDHSVCAFTVSGQRVYVSDEFSYEAYRKRSGCPTLASFDVLSGRPLEWDARVDGPVWALASKASTVYVGGEFAHAGGKKRANLATLDGKSGGATSWRPRVDVGADGMVHGLAFVGRRLCFSATYWTFKKGVYYDYVAFVDE